MHAVAIEPGEEVVPNPAHPLMFAKAPRKRRVVAEAAHVGTRPPKVRESAAGAGQRGGVDAWEARLPERPDPPTPPQCANLFGWALGGAARIGQKEGEPESAVGAALLGHPRKRHHQLRRE